MIKVCSFLVILQTGYVNDVACLVRVFLWSQVYSSELCGACCARGCLMMLSMMSFA